MTKENLPVHLTKVSTLLQAISPEPRLQILLAIGLGEACVCHLKSILGYRQAYISQQLMALREAGLLSTRREGKFVFYRLEKPEVIEIVQLAGRLEGLVPSAIVVGARTRRGSCGCPTCAVPIGGQ